MMFKEIPADTYIRIDEKTNPIELINYLESINEEELINYRKRIYKFLISNNANRFRFKYLANQIIDVLTY